MKRFERESCFVRDRVRQPAPFTSEGNTPSGA